MQKLVCKRNETYIYIQMYIHKHMNTGEHSEMHIDIFLHIRELKHVHGYTHTHKITQNTHVHFDFMGADIWLANSKLVSVDM